MIRMARKDPDGHVRGQALFWLAEKAGKKAESAITGAIENDPDTEVIGQSNDPRALAFFRESADTVKRTAGLVEERLLRFLDRQKARDSRNGISWSLSSA